MLLQICPRSCKLFKHGLGKTNGGEQLATVCALERVLLLHVDDGLGLSSVIEAPSCTCLFLTMLLYVNLSTFE